MSETKNQVTDQRVMEQGDPAADGRAFRRCLGQYPTGVTVITAQNGEQTVGMAVNSFAAVSLDPPLVLWSIRRESKSARDFLEASHFAVNILAADQVDVSQSFGAGDPERFQCTPWAPGVSGAPLLTDAIAHLECKRTVVHEGGDHLILLGQVERYARFEGAPLLFSQGQYAVSQNHPSLTAVSTASLPAAQGEAEPTSFFKSLSVTHQRMSAQFDEHRQALGLTPASTRILNHLLEGACVEDTLERATYLGQAAFEDALADLMAQGYVLRQVDGRLDLTAEGRRKSEAVAERSRRFTQEKLQGISEEDIAATRRVMLALQQK